MLPHHSMQQEPSWFLYLLWWQNLSHYQLSQRKISPLTDFMVIHLPDSKHSVFPKSNTELHTQTLPLDVLFLKRHLIISPVCSMHIQLLAESKMPILLFFLSQVDMISSPE